MVFGADGVGSSLRQFTSGGDQSLLGPLKEWYQGASGSPPPSPATSSSASDEMVVRADQATGSQTPPPNETPPPNAHTGLPPFTSYHHSPTTHPQMTHHPPSLPLSHPSSLPPFLFPTLPPSHPPITYHHHHQHHHHQQQHQQQVYASPTRSPLPTTASRCVPTARTSSTSGSATAATPSPHRMEGCRGCSTWWRWCIEMTVKRRTR